MTIPQQPTSESEPLAPFLLARRIRQGVEMCSKTAPDRPVGDVFYLWLQIDQGGNSPVIDADMWLNVIDEAATVGVNWLVITLGTVQCPSNEVSSMCRWAQETHGMTVCLHSSAEAPEPALEELVASLPTEQTYVLVEPEYEAGFEHLRAQGHRVGLANPEAHSKNATCEFPYKMVYVDAIGNLYTCGLVAGEQEFFLGSVFSGSLDTVVHNPHLPHSVEALEGRPRDGCSGCPPLVAKYLCKH